MKNRVYVVPHTHWDKEWYFTSSRSNVYWKKDMEDILETLENKKGFICFTLDGQSSLVEDYLKWKPEDKERIQKLVEVGRLKIGPWYTQSDLMLISGESLLRNLFYGHRDSMKYGNCMSLAYVPDSFGQSGNMPQIYKDFGLNSTIFWRGVSDEMTEKINFNWVGDDGTNIFSTQIPNGYYTAFDIPSKNRDGKHYWKDVCIPSESKRSVTRNVLITNGFDQAPIRKDLPELICQRNLEDTENEYFISSYETYIDNVLNDIKANNITLENVYGELLSAKHMRVHKSIYSSRADLKSLNTRLQNYIANTMEPVLTLAYSLGFDYPIHVVEEVWKLMLDNAAHDSIGSCISDEANMDVYMRYKKAEDIAHSLVELTSRLISTSIIDSQNDLYTITLINTTEYSRSTCVRVHAYIPGDNFVLKDCQNKKIDYVILDKKDVSEYVKEQCIVMDSSSSVWIPEVIYEADLILYIKNMPSFGYMQIHMEKDTEESIIKGSKKHLENEYYQIIINENGSFNIRDKRNNKVYVNQGVLVDNGEDGDSFNYSPPKHDYVISSLSSKVEVKIETTPILDVAYINYSMTLPYDLDERQKKICSVETPIKMMILLKKNSKVVDLQIEVDNKVLSHRLCIHFDTAISSFFNFVDEQFGTIKRENEHKKEMESYYAHLKNKKNEIDKNVVNWDNNPNIWQEPMIPIEPMQSFVSLSDKERGMAIFPQDVREYEIVGENKNIISITLFRTYGVMGKENLLYRPGRSSGERTIMTPDAQLLKKMTFNMGIYYYDSDFNTAYVSQMAKEYNTPIASYGYGEFLNGRILFTLDHSCKQLDSMKSLFHCSGGLTLSAIKKWDNGDGIVLRFYNGEYQKNENEKISFNKDVKKAYFINGKEEIVNEIQLQNNYIVVNGIGYCKYISILVEF